MIVLSFLYYTESGRYDLRIGNVEGAILTDEQGVADLLHRSLNKKLLGFISQSNSRLYPAEVIEAEILNKYQAIKSLDLDLNDGTVNLSITERAPAYLWCGPTIELDNGDCYFVDEDGKIFAKSASFKGVSYVRLYKTLAGDPLGQYLWHDSYLNPKLILDSFSGISFSIAKLEYDEENVIRLKTVDEMDVLIKADESITDTAKVLRTVLEKSRNSTSTVSSIDVRISNKVYVRYR